MARMYVPSTPYTRGEKEVPADGASFEPRDLTHEELEAQAADRGYRLVPVEPAGNASVEEWVTYARRLGAEDADLVDKDGKELGRDELKAKYGSASKAKA